MITAHIFRCAACQAPSPQAGCRIRLVNGLRTRVCAKCAEQRGKEAPKPQVDAKP